MIANVNIFRAMTENDLAAVRNGETIYHFRGTVTERGARFALDFVNGLNHEVMTEKELSHAIRCLTYRGAMKPVFS